MAKRYVKSMGMTMLRLNAEALMTASWWSDMCTVSQCKAEPTSLVRGPRRSGLASVLPFLHMRLHGHTCIPFDESPSVREDEERDFRYRGGEVNERYLGWC